MKLTHTELNLMHEVSDYLTSEYHEQTCQFGDDGMMGSDFRLFLKITDMCKDILDEVPKYTKIPFYAEVFTINMYAGDMERFTLPFTHGVTVYEYCDVLKKYQRCTSERLLKKIDEGLHDLHWGHY